MCHLERVTPLPVADKSGLSFFSSLLFPFIRAVAVLQFADSDQRWPRWGSHPPPAAPRGSALCRTAAGHLLSLLQPGCSRSLLSPVLGTLACPTSSTQRLSQPGSRPQAGSSSVSSNLASARPSWWPAELPRAPASCRHPPSAPLWAPVCATTGVSGCSNVTQTSGMGGTERRGLGQGVL